LLGGSAALLGQGCVDLADLRQAERGSHRMFAEDFFSTCPEIAMMPKDRGELSGILFGDLGDRSKQNREANRRNTLFAARKDPATKIERAQSSFFDRGST